eukprot:7629980-Ditylum_brightwellii.AAC.1
MASPGELFTHLGRLASFINDDINCPITVLYLDHSRALQSAVILLKKNPTVLKLHVLELKQLCRLSAPPICPHKQH